jgi:hypothetical protein
MDAKQAEAAINQGIADAWTAVERGPKHSLEDHIHYYTLKKTNDNRLSSLNFQQFVEQKRLGTFEQFDVKQAEAIVKQFLQ